MKLKLVLLQSIIIALTLIINQSCCAQIPLPPIPPFFGNSGQESVDKIIDMGMDRSSSTIPPYGKDGQGNPIWPMGDPAHTVIKTSNTTSTPQATIPKLVTNPESVEKNDEKVNSLKTVGNLLSKDVSNYIKKPLQRSMISKSSGRALARLSSDETNKLTSSFLYDLQRHAKFVYEKKNELALAIAYKWKIIGMYHSDQIDTITMKIAKKKGFSGFDSWIESVIREDKKFVTNP